MGKKLATKLADKAPVPGSLNALAMLVTPEIAEQARLERERKEAEYLEREKQDAAYQAHCYRWLERIERWAMKQSRDDLAEHFSLALLLLIETRKISQSRSDLAHKLAEHGKDMGERAEAAQAVARVSIREVLKQTAARKKGAMRRLANDPKQAAKAKARELWLAWQTGGTIHRNQAAFCHHVCEQLELKDTGNVGKWCREWKKQR